MAPDSLHAAIDRTSGMLVAGSAAVRWPWRFTRCWLHVLRAIQAGGGRQAVDAAVADFDALPDDLPGRAALAGHLAEAMVLVGGLAGDRAGVERAAALCAIAEVEQQLLPDLPLTRAVVRAFELMVSTGEGFPSTDPRRALAELERLATIVGTRRPHADQISIVRLQVQLLVAIADGDLGAFGKVEDTIRLLQQRYDFVPGAHAMLEGMAAFAAMAQAGLRGDRTGIAERMEQLSTYQNDLPPGDPQRAHLENLQKITALHLRTWDRLHGRGGGGGEDLEAIRAELAQPGLSPMVHATVLFKLGLAELALCHDDPHMLDAAIEHFGQATAMAPPGVPGRAFYPFHYGSALLARFEARRHRADLDQAIVALEEARGRIATPQDPNWANFMKQLAIAYRLAGRRSLGAETGLDGLRGYAWSAMLQSRTDTAMASVRHAADDAVEVARWCIDDGDADGAVAALDAGRGLVLYAATQIRDVADQLTERGESNLADQWRQAVAANGPEQVTGELRRRVLTVLTGLPDPSDGLDGPPATISPTRLLSPPSLNEIRAALTKLGVDALVYLVAGDDSHAGTAVTVPAHDHPSILALPRLTRQLAAQVGQTLTTAPWTRALSAEQWRDLIPLAQTTLESICEDAWQCAVEPLLDGHLDAPPGRPLRLVLIPMAELVRIPWHAAARRTGAGREYAIERAVFSYAASARMFCDVAWRPTSGTNTHSLFIADPDTHGAAPDLPAARSEASAIRNALYPQGQYLGRLVGGATSPDGPGTPEQVLAWLADHRGSAMLHLACHGVVTGGGTDDTSYLLLDGGARLSAEDLVRAMQATPKLDLGLAVLAACNSGVSGRGYDEAFSVATALLANGARSVINTQWSVPDRQTSALMFMFHHFLRTGGQPPMDALRAAQLWMLDTHRKPPETMNLELRAALADNPVDIATWAGFQHCGL